MTVPISVKHKTISPVLRNCARQITKRTGYVEKPLKGDTGIWKGYISTVEGWEACDAVGCHVFITRTRRSVDFMIKERFGLDLWNTQQTWGR